MRRFPTTTALLALLLCTHAWAQDPAPSAPAPAAAPPTADAPAPAAPAPRAPGTDAPVAAAVPAAAPAAADARIPTLSDKEWATLRSNKVVVRGEMYATPDGKRAGKGVAFVIIDKAPEAAWAVLTDYQKMPEFMPRLHKVTIKQKTPERMKVLQELKIMFKTVEYTLDLQFNHEKKRMDWTLDKSVENDIKDTFGSWDFIPFENGKTLVAYTIAVNTGVAIPQFLEDYLTKKDLPEVLLSMKRRVESGGKYRRD